MSRTRTLTAVLTLGLLAGAAVVPAAQDAPMSTEDAARALVPLLAGVRERIDTARWSVRPGTLPPSPFTGRQSQIIGLTVGKSPVQVDPKVRKAMEQLQAWTIDAPPGREAVLFGHWLTALRLRGSNLRTPPSACDTACVVDLFTEPGEAFGSSPDERVATRDQLLLETLIVAVDEAEPR